MVYKGTPSCSEYPSLSFMNILEYLIVFQDICGIICAVLTWMLIIYAEFVVMAVILIPTLNTLYSSLNTAIFQSLTFLAFASHLRTMFTDPVRESSFLCVPFEYIYNLSAI